MRGRHKAADEHRGQDGGADADDGGQVHSVPVAVEEDAGLSFDDGRTLVHTRPPIEGLFIIDYTANGDTYRTHYLHGEPPFKWADYLEWTKDLMERKK